MTVLAAQDIQWEIQHGRLSIDPFYSSKEIFRGMSFGLSSAGYDVRIDLNNDQEVWKDQDQPNDPEFIKLEPGKFTLAVIKEYLKLPDDLIAFVHDKSTLARMGIAVQNTVIEPGWYGYLTIELTNHSNQTVRLYNGQPIAQIIFQKLSNPTNKPYKGKYQDQPPIATPAILESPKDDVPELTMEELRDCIQPNLVYEKGKLVYG